jgi:ribosomal protein S18 acetylase RimI-like enzyme
MSTEANLPDIEGCQVRRLADADKPALSAAFEGDREYFDAINGRDIPLEEICSHVPPGRELKDKHTLVFERDGQVAGMIDMVQDYPEPGVWYLGFLYVVEGFRGGLGRDALHGLYAWAKAQGGHAIRLGVVEPNLRARHLYATEGFEFEAMREVDPALNRMRRTLVLSRRL